MKTMGYVVFNFEIEDSNRTSEEDMKYLQEMIVAQAKQWRYNVTFVEGDAEKKV